MSIICGTDFSPSSSRAADVAAEIALRLKVPLYLFHALADIPADVYPDERNLLVSSAQRFLEGEAGKFRARGGEVRVQVELEQPEKSLIEAAGQLSATLMVLGATGRGEQKGRQLGSIADRLAQKARIPSLTVRSSQSLDAWFRNERPLRIVVGVDFNAVSEDAWAWATHLVAIGRVELVGIHLYWPAEAFSRLGLEGSRSYTEADPEVERVFKRDLEAHFPCGEVSVRLRSEPSMGRHADRLVALALEEKADLIVVGSHQRSTIDRLWEGSVSRGVLHHAASSVACIPLDSRVRVSSVPKTNTALVATDFSPAGNAAVAHAYGQVGPGGKVCLVHVIAPPALSAPIDRRDVFAVSMSLAPQHSAAAEKLRALIPLSPAQNSKTARLYVLESREPAHAICQAAERLGVDVICLGARGAGGVVKEVIGTTTRPVLLIRNPHR